MDQGVWVLIPAYKPDQQLITLTEALLREGLPVLIVDDGGDIQSRPVFEAVGQLGAIVVRHAVNLGKGRAIKTGINALLTQQHALVTGIVTADADGQHQVADILRVRDAHREFQYALITGARLFTGAVPRKSRIGNAITRFVYRFVTGIPCKDTQTGLRAIPASALPAMLRLPGERYEYEMNMLLSLRALSLPLREVHIDTIYIDNNKGTHFRPYRDSARIVSVICKFALSSIVSVCRDIVFGATQARGCPANDTIPGFSKKETKE